VPEKSAYRHVAFLANSQLPITPFHGTWPKRDMLRQFYFSISETQFRRMESGAAVASSTFVMIRNLCPPPLTS
jgi:hypothetical protein